MKRRSIIVILLGLSAAIAVCIVAGTLPDEILFGIYGDRLQFLPTHILIAFASTFRFLGAIVLLAFLGILMQFRISSIWFSGFRVSLIHGIASAQMLLILYVYARSLLNALIPFVIPITIADVILIIAVLAAFEYRENSFRRLREHVKSNVSAYSSLLFFLFITILLLSFYELPRLVMMSSDPNQHAFWAKQISRFHTLPYFGQFQWGDRNFAYPAGFAVLNYVWHMLSGVDVRNIVAMQPMVQAVIAVLLMFEMTGAHILMNDKSSMSKPRQFVRMFFIAVLFFFLLPHGYHITHPYLEGTARISALAFVGIVISFVYSILTRTYARGYFVSSIIACMTAALLFLFNPALVFIPVILVAGAMLYRVIAERAWGHIPRSLLALLCFLIVFADPNMIGRYISHDHSSPSLGHAEAVLSVHTSNLAGQFIASAISFFSSQRISLFFNVYKEWQAIAFLSLLSAMFIFVLIRYRKSAALRSILMLYAIAAAVVASVSVVAIGIASVIDPRGESFLLFPYTVFSAQQYGYVLVWAAVAWLCSFAFERFRIAGLLVFIGCWIAVGIVIASPGRQFSVYPRAFVQGGIGTVTMDDLAVIRAIEKEYGRYRSSVGKKITFKDTPKIIVPNEMRQVGREQWLFPVGGAWIIPFYDVFPVAFFFFQGSREYSFNNYARAVAANYDLAWLKKNNIKYMFMQSDSSAAHVLKNDNGVLSRHVIFASGKSRFIELW